jgi:hypothetical protein
MMICRLCGLTIEAIPDDAVLIGKLYRFTNGEYHLLRKKLAPRTGPRPRKNYNPDRDAPMEEPTQSTPPVMGTHAYEVPPILPVSETAMERAFRLVKTT